MEIEEIIEEKNLKLTSARRELLEILIQENKPISFEDVKNHIKMDKATFYINILNFEQESIIHSFESHDKKNIMNFKKLHMHILFVKSVIKLNV